MRPALPLLARGAGFALLLISPLSAWGTPFVTEVASLTAGNYTSLALDPAGNPHIVFKATGDYVVYLARTSNGWRQEVIEDPFPNVGTYCSIALDARGQPHVSYYNSTNFNLKYATRNGSGNGSNWTAEVVDAPGAAVGQYTSIAVSPGGTVHIAYYDATNTSLKYARGTAGNWSIIETVDNAASVGQYASLKLDENGEPHVAYHDATNTAVKYAFRANGVWTVESTGAGVSAGSTSLALDSKGFALISYYDSPNTRVRLATRTGANTFSHETVETLTNPAQKTSLTLDASDNPRVAYYVTGTTELRYASRSGTTWTTEIVDGVTHDAGSDPSLALDAQGNPKISYWDLTSSDVRFADASVRLLSPIGGEIWSTGTRQTVRWAGEGSVSVLLSTDGGATFGTLASSVVGNEIDVSAPAIESAEARLRVTRASPASTSESPGYFSIARDLSSPWWHETVDFSVPAGDYSSLALDPGGRPNIAYYLGGLNDLQYATRTGDLWIRETADGAALNSGNYNSLVIDELGNPHISTFDNDNHDLRYVTRSGGVWTPEVVDAAGATGVFSSIALERTAGYPRISYWDQTNGELRYAEKNGGPWTVTTLDGAGVDDVGSFTSLALDSNNEPRIAYYTNTNGDLRYVARTGGVWGTPEVVDGAIGDAGQYASLELDGSDNPHIAYYRSDTGDLRYAVKRNGAWSSESVDQVGSVGAYCSLKLDPQGAPRVSYQDDANDVLKFASKHGDAWHIETIDAAPGSGFWTSLALDADGSAHISHFNMTMAHPYYVSSGLQFGEPAPGAIWPVGATRAITWRGQGRVDISLSVDGGTTWAPIATGAGGTDHRIVVPHAPTRFARLKIERAVPHAVCITPGLFTIQTSIALLSFAARPSATGGAELWWGTDPAPPDLAGYRLERREAGQDSWHTILALTRATSHVDADGTSGARYRLTAVNGLGEELVLGEASLLPAAPLAAWPSPYRGGPLHVSFATPGGLGGGMAEAEVALFDLSGRLVRTLVRGLYRAGWYAVDWDGRDEAGRPVGAGIHFLRARSLGHDERLKVAVMR